MALVNVYSRSPISHKFTVIDGGYEKEQIILGMNTIPLEVLTRDCPKITQVDDALFAKIKDKYKNHVSIFGGKDALGRKIEAQIYLAKDESEAKIMMDDFKPIIGEMQMATKTKGIEKLKEA